MDPGRRLRRHRRHHDDHQARRVGSRTNDFQDNWRGHGGRLINAKSRGGADTPTQRIRNAAVEATVAAAAPPVPPATTTGFSDDFYTACSENVAEARDMAIKAAKQAGYFTAQAAAYRAGKLGQVDAQCEHDATVADAAADIFADLAATAALAACVTRASAVAGARTTTVTYQYALVAEKVKRDIQAEYQEASDMRAEFLSDFPLPPKF